MINREYLNQFSIEVQNAPPIKLKEILLNGKSVRVEEARKTPFWDLDQKKIYHEFDALYAKGVARLAETTPSNLPALIGRISVKQLPLEAKDGVKAAKVGLAGFAGWLVGWVWDNSLSHLILHEYGHAWAVDAIYQDGHPKVSSGALYWLLKGEWMKWFWGVREGAPGNGTSYTHGHLTEFGKWLSPLERDLFILSSGLGVELLFNTTIAGLGLVAMRKKHKALGASLLGFSLISHSAAHSYIRRTPDLLNAWTQKKGGDPPHIAELLAEFLHISKVEAFRFLWFAYLFFPVFLLGFLVILFVKPPNDIPDECVLMRLLAQENKSPTFQKQLTEIELEMACECEEMKEDSNEKATLKVSDALLKKMHKNPETKKLFEKTRKEMAKEIKGRNGLNFSTRIGEIASLVAFAAYQVRFFDLVNAFGTLIHFLSGIFLVAQSICILLNCVQTVKDVANEKLSALFKGCSVTKTLLSVATLVVIAPTLFSPHMAAGVLIFIIAAAIVRLALAGIQYLEMRRISTEETQSKVSAAS